MRFKLSKAEFNLKYFVSIIPYILDFTRECQRHVGTWNQNFLQMFRIFILMLILRLFLFFSTYIFLRIFKTSTFLTLAWRNGKINLNKLHLKTSLVFLYAFLIVVILHKSNSLLLQQFNSMAFLRTIDSDESKTERPNEKQE